jgi:hypothetical protein
MNLSMFEISEEKNTPEINLNPESGLFMIKGKSIPENATRVYEPVIKWCKEYINDAAEETNLHLNLIYFNTASSIWFARMVQILSQIDDFEKLLLIHLYFDLEEFEEMDDDDLKEAIAPVTKGLEDTRVSIGVKIYGTDKDGIILKEKMVLF